MNYDPVNVTYSLASDDRTGAVMDELVAWIREQLDDDEAYARNAVGDHNEAVPEWTEIWSGAVQVGPHEDVVITNDSPVARHMVRHDPARVLRDVEANRLMLDEHYIIERKVNWTDGEGEDRQTHLPVCAVCVPKYSYIGTPDQAVGPCKTVKLLALPYSDRPGYQEAWRS